MVEPTHLKNMSQNGFIFPNFRGENKKYLKPPPSMFLSIQLITLGTVQSPHSPSGSAPKTSSNKSPKPNSMANCTSVKRWRHGSDPFLGGGDVDMRDMRYEIFWIWIQVVLLKMDWNGDRWYYMILDMIIRLRETDIAPEIGPPERKTNYPLQVLC